MTIPFKSTVLITMMMISSLLIVAVVVLAVGRVEKSTVLFHAFHRPVFHFPEFTIPKPELTLQFDHLQRGQRAITIGSPRGFQGTVADGVISSFPEMKQYDWLKVIQFSAAISAGSSGGALFDDEGNVIGITTSSMDDAQNLNFAIPITEVQKLYKKWDKKTYELLGTKRSWDMEGTK